MKRKLLLASIAAATLAGCAGALPGEGETDLERFQDAFEKGALDFPSPYGAKIDTVVFDEKTKTVEVRANKAFSTLPFREPLVRTIYRSARPYFAAYPDYELTITSTGKSIEELVPNAYRDSLERDDSRTPVNVEGPEGPIVRNLDRPDTPTGGLFGRRVVLWNSHGWYYSDHSDKWEWQRPRMFQSVEDLLTTSIILPFLAPMLENAGAEVYMPRERDPQTNEVVIDNDDATALASGAYREEVFDSAFVPRRGGVGFAVGTPPYPDLHNPFTDGSHRVVPAAPTTTTRFVWTPEIPEDGAYRVWISYVRAPDRAPDATYTVYHAGGVTRFRVDQRYGGSTWVPLGVFEFRRGGNAAVELTNKSATEGATVSADVVRFGGGMGVIERGGSTSGRAKWLEAARYYMQYAGMPDTLVYSLNDGTKDYFDDYQGRGEYVNYLMGAPAGPVRDRDVRGLGIPVDLSFALHTDAGVRRGGTIGTLAIFSTEDGEGATDYPTGFSRFASRDFSDVAQTTIVNDFRAKYDPDWNRRQLMDEVYSEALKPNVPSLLLELLSHQNWYDQKFAIDPRFKFDAARAVYKGMLRYLADARGFEPVVQPLAPDGLALTLDGDRATLTWAPVADPLEPSATPDAYIVYERIERGGFDNGVLVREPRYEKTLEPGIVHSFRVEAVNAGGKSFPSETLAACYAPESRATALVVNAFDRVAGPAVIEKENFAGFAYFHDEGVPYIRDLSYVGSMYDFDPDNDFITNARSGHGASHADYETTIVAGNEFDYPRLHGEAIRAAGLSFVSASDEAVERDEIDLRDYPFVDVIFGEERTTGWQTPYADSVNGERFRCYPPAFRERLEAYLDGGGSLMLTGAYVMSDLLIFNDPDDAESRFAKEYLRTTCATNFGSKSGAAIAEPSELFPNGLVVRYRTKLGEDGYRVEAPDALMPAKDGGFEALRYADNDYGAATIFRDAPSVFVMGVPFEAIERAPVREELMDAVLRYFGVGR